MSRNAHRSLHFDHDYRDSICALRKNVIHKAWGSDDIDLEFPNNATPDYVRLGDLSVSLLDGKVESIAFATNSRNSQASVLHALEEKLASHLACGPR